MTRRTGRLGRFEVLVDGKVIARRSAAGWPEPAAVIARIEAMQSERQRV